MEKKIKIEIEIVEDDCNVSCAFKNEAGENLNYNAMDKSNKERVVEALISFAQLFKKGL